jgi:hypothetical protein
MEASGQLHAKVTEERILASIGKDVGWVSEPVLMLWQKEKLYPAGSGTPVIQPLA